jgi:hypothetical protein
VRAKGALALQAPTKPASAVAELDLPEIVTRYAQGESLRELQETTGVGRMALYRWMLSGIGDKKFHNIVTDCLINRVVEADEDLETAKDACDIARAREKARFARMDLERRRPGLYGQKQEIQHTVAPVLHIHLAQDVVANTQSLAAPEIVDAQVIDSK